MSSAERGARKTKAGYANGAYTSSNELSDSKRKHKEITKISDGNSGSHPSPFNKRSRRVTPTEVRVSKGWERQNYEIEDW